MAGQDLVSTGSGALSDLASAFRVATGSQCMDADPQQLNTTPEREEEGKRRRLSSEANMCSTAAAGAASGAAAAAGGVDDDSFTRRDSCQSTDTSCGAEHVGGSPQPPPLTEAVEEMLQRYLLRWGKRLVELQPKVYVTEHLTECGLYLFRYLRQLQVEACYEGQFPLEYLSNERLLIHDLASCWWIALKHCSIRTAVPNRTLMCRATGASPELLSDRELAALIAIDWEVQAVLKQGGMVL